MNLTVKQISSMEKIRSAADLNCPAVERQTVLAGQRFCYQLCAVCDTPGSAAIQVKSDLLYAVRLFSVKMVNMDTPVTDPRLNRETEDYLSYEPGLMPDLLLPLDAQNRRVFLQQGKLDTLWVRVDVPRDAVPGDYPITVCYHMSEGFGTAPELEVRQTLTLRVLPAILPEQTLIYTRWFYADCIADYHRVPVYSEAHWQLIDRYIAAAADSGINMILVPIHTPPLDTAVGTRRTCVQLVDIEKVGNLYRFGFGKFRRFIAICKSHGIRCFEMAHLFSQWGAEFTPNILVTENGVTGYRFGWHVKSSSRDYVNFLRQYITALCDELEAAGIAENTYFHISDEPSLSSLSTYKSASDLIRPLLRGCKILDALSQIDFYEQGLVKCPVTATDHIASFLKRRIPDQWVYYCVAQQQKVSNSFLADPSYRTRVLGFQMYRHDIKGFLHWGYNFYNSPASLYPVNPYVTTSADGYFPSGDGFIVYPGPDTVYPSLRCEVFYEALQDMRICQALEAKIGREAVIQMIDRAAGYPLTFDRYPRGSGYLDALREEMLAALAADEIR